MKVGIISLGWTDNRDTVGARPVMPIANATRKIAERTNARQLFSFDHDVIVSEAVKFDKAKRHFVGPYWRRPGRSLLGNRSEERRVGRWGWASAEDECSS